MKPLVSVCTVTYNHEKFIKDTIEGFLIQKTEFPIEILIHDDCSTDGTAEIIRGYERQYPSLIRGIYQNENQKSKGRAIFPIVWKEAKGEYIALCEGDDYWTDPMKLQKQINLLELSPEYSISFHETMDLRENGRKEFHNNIREDKIFTMRDLTQSNFIASASCVFRNDLVDYDTSWLSRIKAGDWALFFLLAMQGKIHYMKDCMAVYRIHSNGIWSGMTDGKRTLAGVKAMMAIDQGTNYEYHLDFEKGINERLRKIDPAEIEGLLLEDEDAREQMAKYSITSLQFKVSRPSANGETKSLAYKDNQLDSVTPKMNTSNVLAIVCPQIGTPSETFIRKHIDYIAPGKTVVLTGAVLDKGWFHGPTKIIPIQIGRYPFDKKMEAEVLQFLKEHNATHILCEFGCIGAPVIELNQRTLRLPVYVHFHGQDASEFLRRPDIVSYYRWMGETVDGVVAVSKPMAERLIDIGIPSDKIRIIHYGIFANEKIHAAPEHSPCRFVTVSRLVPKKGILHVLDAFKEARRFVPEITLDIIGDGPLRGAIEKYLAGNNLTSCVKMHGQQSNDYVLDQLNKSSVFVLHSMTDPETGNREGLPVSILEASAHALPVISTLHEGIPEEVEHGVTGFLTAEGDSKLLSEYMVQLAKDGELRKKMGAAGRNKIIAEGFTTDEMIKRLREFLMISSTTGDVHDASTEPYAVKADEKRRPKRILFVNHNLYPYENSGTPISTLNHAVGMRERGMEVAVLIPSADVKAGYDKQINDKFTLYRLPRLDKYKAFFGDIAPQLMTEYSNSIKNIVADFAPDIVQINDYVYMPAQIISTLHDLGVRVIRNVCNMEELCHMDYPVISNGLQGKLCKGPESPAKCAECYFVNKLRVPKNKINHHELKAVSEKIEKRFNSVKLSYSTYVDGVIFTEKTFQEYFTSFVNIRSNLMKIIPRGFKFDYVRRETPKAADGKQIRFAYVGHMMFSKGTDVVLNAFEQIASTENFHLDLYGAIVDQAYHDWIVKLERNYPTKIKYHGQFSKADITGIANSISVAIVPSNFDTYNRVVRELLYLGVPQIVTDFFGSSVIHHNVNGLKVAVGDHNALAEAMKKIIGNPGIVKQLSHGAIQTEVPTLDDEVREMSGFYSEIVSRSNAEGDALTVNKVEHQKSSARLVAFYLPQFHPIPENDRWWGKGFTEWTNVTKAKPLFSGHYQPQLPADLGFYDLRLPEVMQSQAELASSHGIEAFCFWHYWFNGKLLLERPLLDMLNSDKPDFQFCLAWANENWTRRWDGFEADILQKQDYGGDHDDLAHFNWLLPFLKDRRAFKIDNKPVFLVYRPTDLPNHGRTIEVWHKAAEDAGLPGIFVIAMNISVLNRGKKWTESGFDGELLFQPNFATIYNFAKGQNKTSEQPAAPAGATIVDYHDIWRLLAEDSRETEKKDNIFASVVPGWDNTARRANNPLVLRDSNPEDYSAWLSLELSRVRKRKADRQVVFINAWNEWAEGNHLEPDLKFGRSFLEATKSVLDSTAIPRATDPADDLYEKAQALIENGGKDQAIATLQEVLRLNRNHSKAMNDLAVLFSLKGDNDSSIKILNRILKGDPENSIAQRNLANIYFRANRVEDSLKSYLKVLKYDTTDISTLSIVAKLCAALNLNKDAIHFFQSILEIEPQNEDALTNLQRLSGCKVTVPDDTTMACTSVKRNVEELYRESSELLSCGKKEEAVTILEDILRLEPNNSMALNDLAVIYSVQGKIESAISMLTNLLAIDPNNVVAQKNLAKLFLRINQIERALSILQNVLILVPDDQDTLATVADICATLNKPGDAKFLYERILACSSDEVMRKQVSAKISEINIAQLNNGLSSTNDRRDVALIFQETVGEVANPGRDEKFTSIVILTYNQLEYTKLTIDSIRKHTKAPYEIIVVDNASSDGTVNYLKAQGDIRTIFNNNNLGFPAGCNQGMEAAKGKYIILLNNDVIVTDEWLRGLIECAESDSKIGIVGPMTNWISGFQLERTITYKKVSQMPIFAAEYRRKKRKTWIEVPRIAGFCMLIKREVVEKIGGLENIFGLGNCEDDDYCLRAKLSGFQVVIAGDVFIHHFGSKSFSNGGVADYLDIVKRNELIFQEKWGITPTEWWKEGKSITKIADLYVPLHIDEPIVVQSGQ